MDIKNFVSVEITGGRSEQNAGKIKKNLDDINSSAGKTKSTTGKLKSELGEFAKSGERSTKKVSAGFKKMDESSSSFNRNLNRDAASSIKRMVGFAAAFAAVSVAVKSVISITKDFEQSVSQLSAITGAVGEDLEFYAAQAREIGKSTTLSASQSVTAFKLIASAKPDLLSSRDALAAVTKEAVTLAEAASISLPEAATALGNSLNQFSAGADEASRFINVLAAGSKFGSSSITDTAEALKAAGAAANAAGISFESTNAGIQALAAGGIKASQAGTGLRNVLLILEEESDKNLRPSVVGLATAIQNLSDKNLTLSETTEIFGRESAIAALTLMEQSESLGELTKNLTDTGVATEQAIANFNNLAGDSLRASSAIQELQIALGTKLTPALRETTQGFTNLTNDIAEFVESDDFEEWINDITFALKALAFYMGTQMTLAIGKAVFAFGGLVVAQTAALTATTALTAGFVALSSATGIGLAITAVAVLTKGMYDLKKAQDDAREGAAQMFSDDLGLEGLDLALYGTTKNIRDLQAQIDESKGKFFSGLYPGEATRIQNELNDQMKFFNILLEKRGELYRSNASEEISSLARNKSAAASVGVLRTQYMDTNENAIELLDTTNLLNVSSKETAFRMKGVKFGLEAYDQATVDLLGSLKQEIDDLGKTERELFSLAITRKMEEGATRGEILAVEELAEALFDEREEIKATLQAKREAADAHEDNEEAKAKATARFAEDVKRENEIAAREAREEWRLTRDKFADFFLDMEENGGNAFDNLAKSFEKSVKRMVAQWLGSGLMKIFGMGGGGQNESGGFSLFGGQDGGEGGGFADTISNVAINKFASTALKSVATSAFISATTATAAEAAAVVVVESIPTYIAATEAAVTVTAATEAAATEAAVTGGTGAAGLLGPLAIGAGALIAGKLIHDYTSNPDGYTRSNSGFLIGDTSGLDQRRLFEQEDFASGLKVKGFNRRSTEQESTKVVGAFRGIDSAFTELLKLAGGEIDLSKGGINGVNEDGQLGTSGTFLGVGGKTENFEAQLDYFATQLAENAKGLSETTMANLRSAETAEQVITVLQGAATEELANSINLMEKSLINGASGIDQVTLNQLKSAESIEDIVGILDESDIGLSQFNKELERVVEEARNNGSALGAVGDGIMSLAGSLQSFAEQQDAKIAAKKQSQDAFTKRIDSAFGGASSGGASSGGRAFGGIGSSMTERDTKFLRDAIGNESIDVSVLRNLEEALGLHYTKRINRVEILDGIKSLQENGGLQDVLDSIGVQGASKPTLEPWKVGEASIDGSHFSGIKRVPFDGYKAELHQGERVKTKAQTDEEESEASNKKQEIFTMNKIMGENLIKMRRLLDLWNATGMPTRAF